MLEVRPKGSGNQPDIVVKAGVSTLLTTGLESLKTRFAREVTAIVDRYTWVRLTGLDARRTAAAKVAEDFRSGLTSMIQACSCVRDWLALAAGCWHFGRVWAHFRAQR